MNKAEFKALQRVEQIAYVNEQLRSGKMLKDVAEELSYRATSLSAKLSGMGYELDKTKQAYVPKQATGQLQLDYEPQKQGEATRAEATTTNGSLSVVAKGKLQENMMELAGNSKELLEMLEWYRIQRSGKEIHGLIIDPANFSGDLQPRSLKLYQNVRDELTEFAEKQKYKVQDLVNQAILEFIEKYR